MDSNPSTDSHFSIISHQGKKYSYDDVRLVSGGILRCVQKSERPIMIRAEEPEAVLLIAACWMAGIPFYVLPEKIPPNVFGLVNEVIRPQLFISEVNEQRLSSETGWVKPSQLEWTEPKIQTDIDEEKPFAFFLTSGTSGTPKVVNLKRKQMLNATKAAKENLEPGSGQGWLLRLPLNHIGGTSVVLRSLLYGRTVFDFRFSGNEEVLKALQSNTKIATASFVPTQLSMLLDMDPDWTSHEKFKAILLGGGPISEKLINEVRKRGIPVIKSYGMTETCAQIAALAQDEIKTERAGSSGRVLEGNQLEIRNESGQKCSDGETGIIWLKGRQVITWYEYPESANTAFDKNGWFNTGDYGYTDQDGYLYVEMRRDDLIVSGGENVNPVYVEEVIKKILPVKDIAVSGIEDEKWGQKVVAFVVAEAACSPDVFKKKLESHLMPYEIPREFIIVNSIPRNPTGKILRKELKNLYSV